MRALSMVLVVLCGAPLVWSQGRVAQTGSTGRQTGLVSGSVRSIIQDSAGIVWLGTQEGLLRYDGYELHEYLNDSADRGSLSNDWVYAVLEDRDGVIWVGTRYGGLNRLDRRTGTFRRFLHDPGDEHSLSSNTVFGLVEDQGGGLWIGTAGGGVCLLVDQGTLNGTFSCVSPVASGADAAEDERITAMSGSGDGSVWIGTVGGDLLSIRSQRQMGTADPSRVFIKDVTHVGAQVTALAVDSGGNAWIGTVKGLARLRRNGRLDTGIGVGAGSSLHDQRVTVLYADLAGRLWIGTRHGGLHRITRTSAEMPTIEHFVMQMIGAAQPRLTSIMEDRSGLLWVGTDDSGLFHFQRSGDAFSIVSLQPENQSAIPANDVRSLARDLRGDVWVGTTDGELHRVEVQGQTYRVRSWDEMFTAVNPLEGDYSIGISVGPSGRLWVGSYGNRLFMLDPVTMVVNSVSWGSEEVPSFGQIGAVFADRVDRVWVGAKSGLFEIVHENAQVRSVDHYAALHGGQPPYADRVRVISPRRDGSLWLGTDSGLSLFDIESRTFSSFLHNAEEGTGVQIRSVLETDDGRVWVGTRAGLFLLAGEDQPEIHLDRDDGLPSRVIYSIRSDNDGQLWLSTTRGLARLDPETLDIRTFGRDVGLAEESFPHSPSLTMPDGALAFGSSNGLVLANPRNLLSEPEVPPVVITSFSTREMGDLAESGILRGSSVQLGSSDRAFAVEFAALDFRNPSRNQYQYRLEGLQDSWVSCGNRRVASFASLLPGEYAFRVRGASSLGVWNQNEIAVHITVLPPLWMRPWFRVSVILALVLAVAAGHRIRTRHLRRRSEELQSINARLQEEMAERQRADAEVRELNESLERRVRQRTSELESLNSELEAFAYSVSHDLRTPLRAIAGFSQALVEDYEDELDDTGRHYLHRVCAGSQRMGLLIDDLLALSRITRAQLVFEDIDFTEMVAWVVQEIAAGEPKRTVEVEIQPGLAVSGDRVLIRTVMQNLIGNAWKYTSLSDEPRIEVGVRREPNRRVFFVRDNGVGFDMAYVEKLFGTFQRLHSTEDFEGTGVGLATVQRIIRRHGGQVWAESTIGEGATFFFELGEAPEESHQKM